MTRGTWYAIGAFAAWGVFPIYWKQVGHVPATQLVGHRILWSFFILLGIVLVSHQRRAFAAVLTPHVMRVYAVAGGLLAINWLTYVWAVNAGFIVETSLGYFITPLISVGLGVLVLREQLRPVQWLAIGLAFMLTFHVFVNVGMTIGVMPVTGLPLPFLSYGGSSLVTNCVALGLLLHMYTHRHDF